MSMMDFLKKFKWTLLFWSFVAIVSILYFFIAPQNLQCDYNSIWMTILFVTSPFNIVCETATFSEVLGNLLFPMLVCALTEYLLKGGIKDVLRWSVTASYWFSIISLYSIKHMSAGTSIVTASLLVVLFEWVLRNKIVIKRVVIPNQLFLVSIAITYALTFFFEEELIFSPKAAFVHLAGTAIFMFLYYMFRRKRNG